MTSYASRKLDLARVAYYRGLYSRVARKLGVDRSFVSRVARGERRSREVEDALHKELRRIEKLSSSRT
jgi:hypothetical protein